MKYFAPLIFCLLIYSCQQDFLTCIRKNDLKVANLKGKVKTIRHRKFKAMEEFGEVKEGRLADYDNYLEIYTENGFISQFEYYDRMDIPTFKIVKNPDSECIADAMACENDTLSASMINLYNFENLIIENREFNNKRELVRVTKTQFNKFGNEIASYYFNATEKEIRRSESDYNEQQDIIKRVYWDDKKNKISTETWRYEYRENIIEYTYKNEESPDQALGCIEKLNKNKDVIERRCSNDSISTYEYTYDDEGNWIKKLERWDGKAQYVYTRSMGYY